MDNKVKKEILKFLSQNKLMSVGTYYKKPWAASVFYLFDDDFSMWFVSNPKTIHCRNIHKNPLVSIVIANSGQNPKGDKIGLQARGKVKKVTSVAELKEIIKAWNKRGFVPITYSAFKKAWKSRFYKIKLTEIKIFDENNSEKERMWKL